MFYTLTKRKELNDESKVAKLNIPFTGIIDKNTLHVGQSLIITGPKKYRITSIIKKITPHEYIIGAYVIETLNSIYELIPCQTQSIKT